MHFGSSASVINSPGAVFLLLALASRHCFSFSEESLPNHMEVSGSGVSSSNRQPKTFFPLWPFGRGIFKPVRPVVTTTITPNPNATTTTPAPTPNLTAEDQVALLIHNAYRISHGVPALTFSPELKTLAMMCAELHANADNLEPCQLIPSASSNAVESLYIHSIVVIPSRSQLMRTALEDWYNVEKLLIGQKCPNFADLKYDPLCIEKVQMIWKSTTQFACATSQRTSPAKMLYTSCVYSPPGNVNSIPQFAANVFPAVA